MIQFPKYFPFIICCLVFPSCVKSKNDQMILENLTIKFPQLKISPGKHSPNYTLIRGVSLSEPCVTIKLYSQPNSVDDKQQIILVTNSDLESYAIPIFSNAYHDYWRFQFDTLSQHTKKINTSFERELNICLDTLNLNDTIGTAGKVVDEILYSLLHCQDIDADDSSNLNTIQLDSNFGIPEERFESCRERLKRNWKALSQELDPFKNVTYMHSYWDKDNSRVYQFDFENFGRRKRNYFKVNIFRQDCNFYILDL